MRLKNIILASSAAAAMAMSANAASAEPDGFYGAVDAGYHIIEDINVESSTNGSNWNVELNDGWAAFGRVGYRFNPNWRFELEGGYRSGDVGTVRAVSGPQGVCNFTPATGPCFSPEGDMNSITLMANVIYDIGGEYWGIRPFVGVGLGVNRVETEFTGNLRQNRGTSFVADENATNFAAQAIAGLAYAVGDRANIDLTYRYLTGDTEFATFSSGTGQDFGEFAGEYDQSHTVTLGLRYAFGAEPAPAPAPLPPAPPAPVAPPRPVAPVAPPAPVARQFVVYFDWDQSSLTSEANSIIGQAAAYAKSGQPTRVLVVGHADTSGSAAYNVGLSNRRARTVADALVAQGIAGGVVSLDGRGETELARATADGVREPLNRRATIDINF